MADGFCEGRGRSVGNQDCVAGDVGSAMSAKSADSDEDVEGDQRASCGAVVSSTTVSSNLGHDPVMPDSSEGASQIEVRCSFPDEASDGAYGNGAGTVGDTKECSMDQPERSKFRPNYVKRSPTRNGLGEDTPYAKEAAAPVATMLSLWGGEESFDEGSAKLGQHSHKSRNQNQNVQQKKVVKIAKDEEVPSGPSSRYHVALGVGSLAYRNFLHSASSMESSLVTDDHGAHNQNSGVGVREALKDSPFQSSTRLSGSCGGTVNPVRSCCVASSNGNARGCPQEEARQRPHPSDQAAFPTTASSSVPLYNWQATKMTISERMAFLFNSTILSDVTFVVGRDSQQQRIPAHKFVLSVGSAVFDAMFNSTLATREDEVELPDVEPASFLALLRFLYSDEVQIGPETVMTTLYTAKKYAVPALEKHCVDFLKSHLCPDNAFMLLTQARLFDEPQLAALCLETIDKSTSEALVAEGFTDIDIDTLSAVLDRDSLRIKEAKLFSEVLRWSEVECSRQSLPVTPENKRLVLGRVLAQIRFPLMTVEEFAQGPAQSGILTDRECVSLFLHFTVNPKPPAGFLDVPRCSMTGKEQTVCRFQQIESRWGYSGTSDRIRFIVDRRIFVVGFGLYGSIHGPSDYHVNIQIIHTGSGRLLGSNEINFSSDGSSSTFRVMFKDPVEIQPTTNYTASATLKGLDSHYGTKGLRKVVVESPACGKVSFQFSYAAGNNNGTSVEDGQIPEIIFFT